MKANIFIAALLLCILGCTSKQSDQLTQQQKDQIRKEVKVVLDSIFARYEKLDVNGALNYYSQEMVDGGDRTLQDFQAYKKAGIDFVSKADSVKWTEDRWVCVVLSKNLVLSYWVGKGKWLFKSKERLVFDPNIYTNIFKNENGQWKVIYEQFSGNPVTQAAEKK
jgi:hypothetical protein